MLLIEPGRFRTKLLSPKNVKSVASTIQDYTAFSNGLLTHIAEQDGAQVGDPKKLVDITLDLVRREGVTAGREVPLRLPLGNDVFDDIKAKCEETLKLLNEWETVIRSTDY